MPKGESVIVETARGVEIGEITMERAEIPESEIVAPLKKVLRAATEEDKEHARENCEKEKWALGVCQEKIVQHNLDMKLIDVEYTFDNNKILFYFTSDGRVDFRDLVKDLAAVFRTRIELRQIGVRDEAKILGGIGICGRCLCCNSFLGDFHPVSIKMAKEQGLSLNPTKISGSCGRLMCCLKYEQDAYEYLLSKTPGVGAVVETAKGRGVVVSVSLLKGLLKVRLEDGNESDLIEFAVDEVRMVKSPSRRYRVKSGAGAGADADTGADAGADAGADTQPGPGGDGVSGDAANEGAEIIGLSDDESQIIGDINGSSEDFELIFDSAMSDDELIAGLDPDAVEEIDI
jgi:cell fate regulator YaaT (PSP1 superfamily)